MSLLTCDTPNNLLSWCITIYIQYGDAPCPVTPPSSVPQCGGPGAGAARPRRALALERERGRIASYMQYPRKSKCAIHTALNKSARSRRGCAEFCYTVHVETLDATARQLLWPAVQLQSAECSAPHPDTPYRL